MRTPDQINDEIKQLVLALLRGGMSVKCMESLRFYITPEEAEELLLHMGDRMIEGNAGARNPHQIAIRGVRLTTQTLVGTW